MNHTQTIILSVLRNSLFKAPLSQPELFDWPALLQEAHDQAMVGLVTPVVKKYADEHDVPNLDQWITISDQVCAHFVRCFQAQRELVKLFEDNGIPLVIVKGYAAAVYYPTPRLRSIFLCLKGGSRKLRFLWSSRAISVTGTRMKSRGISDMRRTALCMRCTGA